MNRVTKWYRRNLESTWAQRIDKCPALAQEDRQENRKISAALADEELRVKKAPLGVFVAAVCGALTLGLYLVLLFELDWFFVIMGSLYIAETVVLFVIWPRRRYWRLVIGMFDLLESIETSPDRWGDPNFRGSLNRKIESVARSLDRIWRQLRPGDTRTEAHLRQTSHSIARSLRELKLWVATPTPLTYTDLTDRITHGFRTVLEGRWYDLPQSAAPIPAPRRVVAKALLFLAAIGAIVLSALLAVQSQDAARVASPLVGTAGLLLLNSSGISLSSVAQATETIKTARQ